VCGCMPGRLWCLVFRGSNCSCWYRLGALFGCLQLCGCGDGFDQGVTCMLPLIAAMLTPISYQVELNAQFTPPRAQVRRYSIHAAVSKEQFVCECMPGRPWWCSGE
jgi:hypothetical protein